MFSNCTLVSILLSFLRLANMIVNTVLGIGYFLIHRPLVHLLLSVIYLINMFVNVVLGIRYLFSHSLHSSEFLTVGHYDCQCGIRY